MLAAEPLSSELKQYQESLISLGQEARIAARGSSLGCGISPRLQIGFSFDLHQNLR
jgi:hypothetical protein